MEKLEPNELPVPPAAFDDPEAGEMIRVWIAAGGLHCSLNIGRYKPYEREEEAWGTVLADVIRHVSNAMAERYGTNKVDTVNKIYDWLTTELYEPTTDHSGSFVKQP